MKRTLIIFFISLSTSIVGQNPVVISGQYICPPCNNACDEAEYDKPGVCSHCNMVLIKKDQSKTIAFYLQDGVEVLDFAGPMEVFAYAGYKVFTVSADKAPIRSQGILKVTPDYSIENAPQADILAFFGGNSTAAYENPKVIEWVRKQENVNYHFSVCTGAFVLAEAGLLNGKTATTFHDALDGLENNYPEIDVRRDVRFIDNGTIITTAGVSAGIDGALHLVAKLQGLNAAKRTAYYMEYDNWTPGDGLIRSEDNPYMEQPRTDLEAYLGKYEFEDGKTVQIVMDTQRNELQALMGKNVYPIYHETGDLFSDVRSEPIYFERNEREEIIGYKLSPEGELFRKTE